MYFTTIAALGFAVLLGFILVEVLAEGRSLFSITSDAQAVRAILGIVGQIPLVGAAITLYATISGARDEPNRGDVEGGVAAIRDLIGQLWSIIAMTIGGAGVAGAIEALIRDLATLARTGNWHITSFCETAGPQPDRFCPVHVPVFSLIFGAPAFIVYFVIGVLLLRQNMRTFRGYPE